MNTKDKKDVLLFEVMEIYDNTINTFLKTYKRKNGEVKHKLNIKYPGFWLYLFSILFYLTCFIPCIFSNNLFFPLCIIIGTIFFVILIIYEQHMPKANYYDLFTLNVEKYNFYKLEFLLKYIDHLTSEKAHVTVFNNVLSFLITFFISNIIEYISKKNNLNFSLSIINKFIFSFMGIIVYNIIKVMSSYKNIKLLKIKKFIQYVLLCREIEKINIGS